MCAARPVGINNSCVTIKSFYGRNLVGSRGRVPHFFLYKFCIWRGFKNKSDVYHVLFEERFMLDGRLGLHIAKFMLTQSLVFMLKQNSL